MWHYLNNGNTFGPVDDAEARNLFASGAITPETLVWRQGMDTWQPARACPFFVPPGASPPPPPAAATMATARPEDHSLDCIAHVLGLLTGFIGPLILMLCTQEASAKRHATEALNWQLSLLIYMVVSFFLVFLIVGIFTLIAVVIMDLVFCIIAAVKAGQGVFWKYPMSIPFVK